MTRKILATILAITMVITSMSTMVFAESNPDTLVSTGGTVTVNGQETTYASLTEAATAEATAPVDGVITYTINGPVEYITGTELAKGDAATVKIVAATNAEADSITLRKNYHLGFQCSVDLTIENITVNDLSDYDSKGDPVVYPNGCESSLTQWEFMNIIFNRGTTATVLCKNVTFTEGVMVDDDDDVSFEGCTFNVYADNWATSKYALWIASSSEIVVNNCEFNGDRAIKVDDTYGDNIVDIVVKNSKFNNLSQKPAIVYSNDNGGSLEIDNNTVITEEYGKGILAIEAPVTLSGSDVADLKASVTSDGETTYYASVEEAVAGNDVVAKTDDSTYFETLGDAFKNTTDSKTITLLDNIELESTASIEGKTVTLDLNGYTVTAPVDAEAIEILSEATLTIKDSSEEKTGCINSAEETDSHIVVYADASELNLESGTINGNEYSVYLAEDSVMNMTGGKITAGWGYGIVVLSDTVLNISNGEIISEAFAISGNGMHSGTEINITGGSIRSEDGPYSTDLIAIYHPQGGELNISGGTISGSTAIYARAGEINISGGTLIATGEAVADSYDPNEDGAMATGDAVVITACDYPSPDPTASITGGNISSANADAIATYQYGEGSAPTKFISGGNFSSNISEYLADGLVAVTSSQSGYKYSVAEKAVDVETTITPAAPSVSVEEGITINTENFAADNDDLNAAAASLANDSSVVGTKEDAKTALTDAEITVTDDDTVSVVVVPYTDINVSNVDTENETMTVSISPKYDVVATTNSSEIITEGEGVNAVVLNEAQTLEVTTPMSITLALPTDYAEANDTIYVHHEVDGTTYVYEATVSEDAATATFTNNNGFESTEFVVKKAAGAAKIGDTVYATLADAVKNVAANETIVLLADNAETVTVAKTITFSLDKDIYAFTGEIDNGSYTKVTTTENGNVITYTFRYTSQNLGGGGGGGGSMVSAYTVKVKNTDNGNITASAKTAKKGAIVTLSVVADDGYELKTITVTDNDNEEVDVTEEAGNYVFKMPGSDVVVTAEFVAEGTAQEPDTEDNISTFPFIDIAEDFWGYEAIAYCWENGIMNGMTETEFDQARPLTRAMLVTMLYRLAGTPEVVTTENEWYSAAQAWAMESGISDGTFMTNEVTREQLVTMLYRYAGMIEADLTAEAELTSFTDNAEISEYATDAAEWAFANGLINGMGDGTLAPKSSATRAQVAAMFMRFIENIVK